MNLFSDDQSGLPSPRSDHDHHGTLASEQRGEQSTTSGGGEDQMPHGSRRRKQKEHDNVEPERNGEGKIICTHPKRKLQCAELTFERKCEWVKHVDKHDRPYKCEDLECIDLRGFTYSGGLLRHQREVHKKFGGPKATVFCPFPYCKRNTGIGFTRAENLKEHIRRVHRTPEESEKDTAEAKAGVVELEGLAVDEASLPRLSYTAAMVPIDINYPPAPSHSRPRKRRKGMDGEAQDGVGAENLKLEIARLQNAVDERDQHIAHLNAVIGDRDMTILKLQQEMRELTSQGLAQQAIIQVVQQRHEAEKDQQVEEVEEA